MYDVKTLPRTPGMARRLLQFAQLNDMQFDSQLAELALEDLLDHTALENFPYEVPASVVPALQHIRDWQGRAMLFCTSKEEGMVTALAHLWTSGQKRTLILTKPNLYPEWAEGIQKIWPDAKISVFGNQRYQTRNIKYPAGIEFQETPDLTADVMITSYTGVIWNNLIGSELLEQTVVDELDNNSAYPYKWEATLKEMFREIPSPLFIQNINSLPKDAKRDIVASLMSPTSQASEFVLKTLSSFVWGGIPLNGIAHSFNDRPTLEYLNKRGYGSVDLLRLFSLLGASSHLLDGNADYGLPLVFHDTTLAAFLASGKTESKLVRLKARECDLEEAEEDTIANIVARALADEREPQGSLDTLRTQQWATLKGSAVKAAYASMSNRFSKCLYLVESPDLARSLKLHFGPQIDVMPPEGHDQTIMRARFNYPTSDGSLTWQELSTLKPFYNIILTLDDLIKDPRILEKADFVFVPELSYSQEDFNFLREAINVTKARIVLNVLDKSFEEEIFNQLFKTP